jgi:hypothetical protein
MIEPHSAHDGASAWVWKLTFVAPRFIENPPLALPPPLAWALPLPFAACPLAAPFVATTASSSRGAVADATGAVEEASALGVTSDDGWPSG